MAGAGRGGAAFAALSGAAAVLLLAALIAIVAVGGSAAAGRAGDLGCGAATGLNAPAKKEIAQQLVSSAENSSLEWRKQYGYCLLYTSDAADE